MLLQPLLNFLFLFKKLTTIHFYFINIFILCFLVYNSYIHIFIINVFIIICIWIIIIILLYYLYKFIDKYSIYLFLNPYLFIFLTYFIYFTYIISYNIYDYIYIMNNIEIYKYLVAGNTFTTSNSLTKYEYLQKSFKNYNIPYMKYECLHSYEHIKNTVKGNYHYFPLLNESNFSKMADAVIYNKDNSCQYVQYKTFTSEKKFLINRHKYDSLTEQYKEYSNIIEIGCLHEQTYNNSVDIPNKINLSYWNDLATKEFMTEVDNNLSIYTKDIFNSYFTELNNVKEIYLKKHYGNILNINDLETYKLNLKKNNTNYDG